MVKGYKQMIRDRMPRIIDLALMWCKAKGRWIDHVYENIVKKYPQDKRSTAVKIVLGIKQQYKRQEIYDYFRYVKLMPVKPEQMYAIPKDDLFMPFKDTINWQSLDPEMYEYWKSVVAWVNWFRTQHMCIEDTYRHSLSFGNDLETTKSILMSKYNMNKKLTDYIIKSFK